MIVQAHKQEIKNLPAVIPAGRVVIPGEPDQLGKRRTVRIL